MDFRINCYFMKDSSQLLGYQSDLPPILSYKNIKPRAINICDDVHANVRRLLVDHGTDAAIWIKEYLMENPTVEIASPEYLCVCWIAGVLILVQLHREMVTFIYLLN
ncbi:hypothetical protein QTG54_008397 [Skeletonema marinoi]|uniref:Uncharacterized protein n=1 Tax=Skeletonema marinoi TaxID=267567 RepID=A0AAD8Y8T8_9STRA|nr:hypothetical protein QTG54_008397 [Skeletonema marinoi]